MKYFKTGIIIGIGLAAMINTGLLLQTFDKQQHMLLLASAMAWASFYWWIKD